jgi:membrane-associated phospholipid phosphatase
MRVRPLEIVNAIALGVTSLLVLVLWRRLTDPGALLVRYALLAAGVATVAAVTWRRSPLPGPVAFAADFYPAAFLPFYFNTLGPLIEALRGGPRDDLLIAADRALFGVDVTVWLERWAAPPINDLFFLAYTSYYFIALVLGIALWSRRRETARRFIFTLAVSYFVSYAGYFALPALGPRYALAQLQTEPIAASPISAAISETIDKLERTKLDVFPSGHTMIAVVVLIVAWQRARRLFWWLLPVAVLLIVSTVWCRYHYVVDVIAGAALAFVTVPLGDRLYDGMLRREAPEGHGARVV